MSAQFVVKVSRGRSALLFLGSLLFLGFCGWLAGLWGTPPESEDGAPFWLGVVGVAVFGFVSIQWARQLVDTRDLIVVDDVGITVRAWSDQHIPWSAITDSQIIRVRNNRFLALFLGDALADYPATTRAGKARRLTGAQWFGDIAVTTAGMDQSFDALMQAVTPHILRTGAP